MPHATLPSSGLQALILCGPGSSLSTFTSNPKDFPKAIVPIANRPMVWYSLDWCYRMGVTDITLITAPESRSALEAALATNPSLTSLPSPKPEVLAPADLTQTTGTGELLRLPEVQQSILTDFIVLPCDLLSELDGTRLLTQWMTLNPLSSPDRSDGREYKGGLALFYPTYGLENISTKKDETDFLATVPISPSAVVPPAPDSLRPHIEQIVLTMPTDTLRDTIEADKGSFRLRQSLLSRHSRLKFRTKYRDAHVYIFPRWVKDFVARNEAFESVSEDLLGWWTKASWQDWALAEKLGLGEILNGRVNDTGNGAMELGNDIDDETDGIDIVSMSSTKASSPATTAKESTQPFASRVQAEVPTLPRESVNVPQLLVYAQPALPQARPIIRRLDTTPQLLSLSLYLAKLPPSTTHALAAEHKIHPTAHLEAQSRVAGEDCLIAENVKIGFRSNIKETVVGANCEIGKNVRLTRCLLMEGVVVGDGVVMTGCVVGKRARVDGVERKDVPESGDGKGKGKTKAKDDDEDKTKLVDCEIAPGFVVEAGIEAKGEKFMGFDTEEGDIDDEEGSQGDGMEGGEDK